MFRHPKEEVIEAPLTDFEIMEKYLCEESLLHFITVFWPEIEGSNFTSGWHIEAICEHLEAVTRCDIRKLVINGPPRSSKSRPVSIFWQPWDWIKNPQRTWITAGNTQRLAVEFNHASRQLMRCDKFKRYWGHIFQFDETHDLKTEFLNTKGGRRLAVGANTRFIGAGGERKILDDPHMPGDSAEAMMAMGDWFFRTWRTRTNNPKTACEVLTMQRLSVYDLCEQIKTHESDLWEWLILPSRFDPKKRTVTVLGWTDPRTEEGQLLWPEYLDDKEERQLRRSLKESADAQMDQDPTNDEDTLYKNEYLGNFYKRLVYNPETDVAYTSTDTAMKSKKTSDFTACTVGLKKGHMFFHIGGFADKFEPGGLIKRYIQELSLWHNRNIKFYVHAIEDSTMGPVLKSVASKKFPRIKLIPARRQKLARFKHVVPIYEANRVWYPAPGAVIIINDVEYPIDTSWVEEWLKQTRQVPGGANDDCPDADAQIFELLDDVTFEVEDEFLDDDEVDDEEDRFIQFG